MSHIFSPPLLLSLLYLEGGVNKFSRRRGFKVKVIKGVCHLFLFSIIISPVFAEWDRLGRPATARHREPSIWENRYLVGDWGGRRTRLEENGISFDFVYTGEVASIVKGGIKTGITYLANVDITMTLDTELSGLWDGGKFFVYFLDNHGGKPSVDYIGDLQTVSNIEATDATRLYELWYEQRFFNDKFSILLGQHDLNSEFNMTEYGDLFIQSSFGIEPDISSNVPVSIFPVAGPAVRLKWKPKENLYLMAGVYDGDPGGPEENPTGTDWRLSSEEGAMTIYEAGLGFGERTYKLGAWYHTAEFNGHSGNYGVYFITDQMVYREKDDQGLGVFFQIGGVPEDRNEVDFYLGGGLHYHGLIPGRDEDDIGIGVAHASISDELEEERENAETVLELTYRAEICPWFSVQPDIQYVFNPGADPSIEDALVGLVRCEVGF